MKHTYHIRGMSCLGCVHHVREALQKVSGVKAVEINLETGHAIINMESHIPIEKLAGALKAAGGSYTIYTYQGAPSPAPPGQKVPPKSGNTT